MNGTDDPGNGRLRIRQLPQEGLGPLQGHREPVLHLREDERVSCVRRLDEWDFRLTVGFLETRPPLGLIDTLDHGKRLGELLANFSHQLQEKATVCRVFRMVADARFTVTLFALFRQAIR